MINTESPNVKLLHVVVDVTDEESVLSMVNQAVEAFGTLDCGEPGSL